MKADQLAVAATLAGSARSRITLLYLAILVLMFGIATPVLADYLGPNRTSAESHVETYDYGVWAKDDPGYPSNPTCNHSGGGSDCIVCTWTHSPGNACGDAEYWYKTGTKSKVVTTTINLPPATISGSLQNCNSNNGWCVTAPQLSLAASEPLSGYKILAIEGSRNGQTFACSNSTCSVPLNEGNNNFTFWALSSYGDSSTMGMVSAKVDSQQPTITGTFSGTAGSNGWYLSPVFFNGNASDATSGLASFTCTLDGTALDTCNSITVNSEGGHTLVLTARDNAGNTRTLTQNASLDMQNPSLASSLSGILGSNNWYNAATLNATASDPIPGSGLSAFEYNLDNSGWITFPSSGALTLPDGKHGVDIRAVDRAGRTVSSSKFFWLDSIAPDVTLDLTGTLGSNNWYTSSLTVAASASDGTSGIDIFEYNLDNGPWTTYVAPPMLMDGTHVLSVWAQDKAGLVTQIDRMYQVDTHAPQIVGNVSGIPGTNNWYISQVTLTASASDPTPGSGLDKFTYALNGGADTPYNKALTLSDGEHTVQLNAQDKAGLTDSTEQSIKVDIIHPSLSVQTALPNWIKESVTLSGTSTDSGSGLSKVEISSDGGQTWQTTSGTTSWSYTWNTFQSSNGMHEVRMRATDNAGLTTKQTFNVGVDNHAPKISLPDSWYQWDTVTLDIWDRDSGLSEARIEISDPDGRWPKRVLRLDSEQFPLDFKWDRRFGDGTIAPLGIYDLEVIAFDNLGQMARRSASINILLGILPGGPTSTPQPYVRGDSTPAPIITVAPTLSSIATQSPIVSAFGSTPEAITQSTSLLTTISTPRATPTQNTVLDWLQSVFAPNSNTNSITEISSTEEAKTAPQSAVTNDSSVLWGAGAAAVIGAATAYTLDAQRKRKEEEARQLAEAEARAAKLNAAEEQRKVTAWLEGQAILNAQIEEAKNQGAIETEIADLKKISATQGLGVAIGSTVNLTNSLHNIAVLQAQNARMEDKMERLEAEEEAQWVAQQIKDEQAQRARDTDIARWNAMAAYGTASNPENTLACTPDNPHGIPRVDPRNQTTLDWLTALYGIDNLPGNTAMDRTRYLLNATNNGPSFLGIGYPHMHFANLAPGDRGFDPQYQDWAIWPDSGNQAGHFLTAVDFSLWANDRKLPPMYSEWIAKPLALGSVIGHEMVGDGQGPFIQTTVGILSNLVTFGAVNRWFLSGEDKNFHKIVGNSLGEGNSMQDLRLSYQGWVAGEQLSNGNIQTTQEFSQWLKDNLK
jgi:hypothetical protein